MSISTVDFERNNYLNPSSWWGGRFLGVAVGGSLLEAMHSKRERQTGSVSVDWGEAGKLSPYLPLPEDTENDGQADQDRKQYDDAQEKAFHPF